MIIRTVFILNFLITGCTISQVATDQSKTSNDTGDVMGMIYDEDAFFIRPPFYLILFNQNKRFTKLVKEFSFSFDSIPTGSYKLVFIDSAKSENFIQTDTVHEISIATDSISMVSMKFYGEGNESWFPIKIHRQNRGNTGSIEGRFNVEKYEEVTGCKFAPVKSNYPRPEDKGKYTSIYLMGSDSFKQKTHTDSLGNFKLDSIPVGFYELYGSKANHCNEWVRVFNAFKVIGIIVSPDRTSIVHLNKIQGYDPYQYPQELLDEIKGPDPTYKWNPQFKKRIR